MTTELEETYLRQQILTLFPELKEDIGNMGKTQLEELIQFVGIKTEENESQPEPIKQEKNREFMIQQIMILCKDISKEQFEPLNDEQVKQIYEKYMKKAERQRNKIKRQKDKQRKKKIIQNGKLNVFEMKKFLIDKLPQYRVDIRNLPDEDIKKMFRELQGESSNDQKQEERLDISVKKSGNSQGDDQSFSFEEPNEESKAFDVYDSHFQKTQRGKRKRGRPRKVNSQSNTISNFTPIELQQGPFQYQPIFPDRLEANSSENAYNFPQKSQLIPFYAYEMSPHYSFNEVSLQNAAQKVIQTPKRCKFSIYLDFEDLEELNQHSKQKPQQAGNQLALIIKSLHETFKAKPWKDP